VLSEWEPKFDPLVEIWNDTGGDAPVFFHFKVFDTDG
jgi:hypothetical protein